MPEPETTPKPPEATPPPPPTPPAAPPDNAGGSGDGGKTVQLQHADFKRIKDEAESKGRQRALAELETIAQAAGFESAAAAFQAMSDLKKQQAARPINPQPPENVMATPKPPKPNKPVTVDKAAQEAARRASLADEERQRWKSDRKARRRLERDVEAKDTEIQLRGQIYGFGVTGRNVDYVLHQLRLDMRGKSVEELAKYDPKAFVETLRKDQPYLFGETVQPATTGTNGTTPETGTPATPPAGQPTVDAAAQMQFDARSAKPEAVSEFMKKLGLDPTRMT
jgi:hypothetical protein